MEITSDLLLDCLTLLINDNSTKNQTVIQQLLKLQEDDKSNFMESSDGDLIKAFMRMIRSIISNQIDRRDQDALKMILVKFKSDKAYDTHRSVFDDLQIALTSYDKVSTERLEQIMQRIQNTLLWHNTSKMVKRSTAMLFKCSEIMDPEEQHQELTKIKAQLDSVGEMFQNVANGGMGGAKAFETINFHDRESIHEGIKRNIQRDVTGVIRTGLQGLNRALGTRHGFALGESITFNALPHCYKSGILVSCALWAIIHNLPHLTAEEKTAGVKQLVYFVSLENEAYQNMIWIFKKLYQKETGRPATALSEEQTLDWISQYFMKFDTVLVIERHNPQEFGPKEYFGRLTYFKANGYRVVMSLVDYAILMKTSSDDPFISKAGRDVVVKRLFSSMCNYTKMNSITWVTAHPLNRRAKEVANGTTNAVKKFNLDFLADSIDVEREVDVSIYMHIEKNNATQQPFLTFLLTKHRYEDDTPESHKYFAYPFVEGIGIQDDVDGTPGYTNDIYEYVDASQLIAIDTQPVVNTLF